MKDEKTLNPTVQSEDEQTKLSENWPEEAVQDILDYIEEQGIYIRE